MKKIYGFLGALAILSMVGCSKEADLGSVAPAAKGDLFMTMTIAPSGSTRTKTPNQGSEVGKDRENAITTALVIFGEETTPGSGVYKKVVDVFAGSATDTSVSGSGDKYTATFAMDRDALLKDISGTDTPATTEKKTYTIFIIANPTDDLVTAYSGAVADIQKTFDLATDADTYWQDEHFLMTNAELTTKEIDAALIQPGTFTTRDNAFSLGTVKIQRAMSRFDLATATDFTVFTVREADTEGAEPEEQPQAGFKELKVTFDAIALVNMATQANMFKVTGADKRINFTDETADNWVYTPTQTSFLTPMFVSETTGAAAVTDGKLTGKQIDYATLFTTNSLYGGYTKISEISEADNDYVWPKDENQPQTQPEYSIWRYAMENTNPDQASNQVNGNSTGVVFRAEITGQTVSGAPIPATENPKAIYAYNSVVLGYAEDLQAYATNDKSDKDQSGVYDAVKMKYAQAVKDAVAAEEEGFSKDEETGAYTYGALSLLDKYLVKQGFSIYRPSEDGHYYCYYIYWNRHNDNGQNTIMGNMEFATVRNNIYKLRVNKVNKLGHPGKPGDDPDPNDPDDPNEKDSFYCEIICQVLDWEVRHNDIEF